MTINPSPLAFNVSRRALLAGGGALVVSFSSVGVLAQQAAPAAEAPAEPEPPKLPGALDGERFLELVDQDRRRQHDHRLHRQGRARPGHPHGTDPGRRGGARGGTGGDQPDLRRHGSDPERRIHRRQPVDAEQRNGDPQRRCAGTRPADRRGRKPLQRAGNRPARRGRRGGRRRRPLGDLRRTGLRAVPARRGATGVQPEAARTHSG